MFTRAIAAACWVMLYSCLCTLSAQNFGSLSGAIVVPEGVDPSRYVVEATPLGGSNTQPERVTVQSSGRFDIRTADQGTYTIRVFDEQGVLVGGTTLSSGSVFGPAEIRISGKAKSPIGSGSVSLKRLRADPDGKADREMNNGLWYARDKNWEKARKHFEKALRADAQHTRTLANWSALELQQGNATEAESLARRGLAFEPQNTRLLHALGVSLFAQGVFTEETAKALEAAGREQPKLYLAAAEVAYRRGNAAKAHQLAETYMRTGEREHLQAARDIAGKSFRALPKTAP